jgi:hypothetical protein
VFHGRAAHGGRGNWGRALAVRYAGDDAAWRWSPGAAIPTAPPVGIAVVEGVDGSEGAGGIDARELDGRPLGTWPGTFPLAFEEEDAHL